MWAKGTLILSAQKCQNEYLYFENQQTEMGWNMSLNSREPSNSLLCKENHRRKGTALVINRIVQR